MYSISFQNVLGFESFCEGESGGEGEVGFQLPSATPMDATALCEELIQSTNSEVLILGTRKSI